MKGFVISGGISTLMSQVAPPAKEQIGWRIRVQCWPTGSGKDRKQDVSSDPHPQLYLKTLVMCVQGSSSSSKATSGARCSFPSVNKTRVSLFAVSSRPRRGATHHGRLRTSYRSILFSELLVFIHGDAGAGGKTITACKWDHSSLSRFS